MSPPHLDNSQLGGMSSVQSQNQQKAVVTQSPQQSQQSYMNAVAAGHGSAFVTYNTKPAPGFPPVTHQTGEIKFFEIFVN